MKESDIERQVVEFCQRHNLLCFKFVSPGHRGVPDRLIIGPGKVLFLELKRPGGYPTALQCHYIAEIAERKHTATWVDNYEQAKQVIRRTFGI